MTDRNKNSCRSLPNSYSDTQHDGSESFTDTDTVQRAADAMIANSRSYTRQYYQNEGVYESGHIALNRSLFTCDSPSRYLGLRGSETGIGVAFERGGPSPHFSQQRFSPEMFPNLSASSLQYDGTPRKPESVKFTDSLGEDRPQRYSNNPFAADLPRRTPAWSPMTESAATLFGPTTQSHGESASHVDCSDSNNAVYGTPREPSGLKRKQSHVNGSIQSLPGDVIRGRSNGGGAHLDLMSAARSFRFANSPTFGPLATHRFLSEETSIPHTIQIGRYTYIRDDTQTNQAEGFDGKTCGKPPSAGKFGGISPDLLREIAFVLIIAAAQALMLAGVSQALVPATIIGKSFGLSQPAELAWFSAAYALTSGTFVLPAGRLGDLFGHKRIFVIGFFWFAVWSLITGFALQVHENTGKGVIYFNVCRAIQGIGPALQVPNGQAMLGRAYKPGPRKAYIMSLFGAAAPFGFVVGGVMSSLFAQLVSWPWSFWALAAVCVAFGSLSVIILPNSPVEKRNRTESLWTQLDATGMVLGVSGLVLFNFSWNQAAQVTWNTPYVYFLLIISLLLVGGFAHVESHSPYPLVPITAMRSQTNFVLACTAAGWGCFSVWVFYSCQYLEIIRGWSPLLAAAAYSPGPVTGLIASLLVGRYMMRVGAHWIMLVSMTAFFAGSVLMVTMPINQIYWGNTFFSILIMPFGMDMSNPAATIILSNSVSKEHQGIAASLVVTVVNYSISTALGFAATIETRVSKGGTDVVAGFKGAQYFGMGLGVLGCAVAFTFAMTTLRTKREKARKSAKHAEILTPLSSAD